MKLLALDTSTDRMSLGIASGEQQWLSDGVGGAQASAQIIAQIQTLLQKAELRLDQLDAIVCGNGPGSFTGIRTACSVAQGLALGAGLPVLTLPSLLAVAQQAHQQTGAERIVAALDARMQEIYLAHYDFSSEQSLSSKDFKLVSPEECEVPSGWLLAGNAHLVYGERMRLPAQVCEAWPSAAALLTLAPALVRAGHGQDPAATQPLYIRDKVALTSAERAALKALPDGAQPA